MLRIRYVGPTPDQIRRRLNDTARQMVDARMREIERLIRQVRCPIHHRSPNVWRSGNQIRFSACCQLAAQLASRIAGV
jgi:hypothetical protein